jgi:DNA-binding NarL/FixJ family response regulator
MQMTRTVAGPRRGASGHPECCSFIIRARGRSRTGTSWTSGCPAATASRRPATSWPPRAAEIRQALTSREQEVFTYIATGQSNSEIAATLFLSEGTVKIHVGRILAKLGLRDRVQAVVLAYESRLISPGPPPPSSRR